MKKITKIIMFIFIFILLTFGTGYLLYAVSLLNNIENMARLLLSITLVAIWLCVIVSSIKSLKSKKSKLKIVLIFVVIYALALSFLAYYIIKAYSIVAHATTNSTAYTTSLVTLKSNKAENIKDVKGSIGILEDTTSIVGNTLPLEIIEKNNLKTPKEYDNFIDLIKALLNKEVDYAFLPANYVIMFSEVEGANFEDLEKDTKVIYTKTKKVKEKAKSNEKLDKPFTILLMGVDSELEGIANASFNGDSLILITFNPKTLSSTIMSIPRDSYVPIACFPNQRKNKITHAAWYGETCMIDTIENFTGIEIDYFVKINFKGVVSLVDELGGVEVDVPYAFCEQNSNREWGNSTIYLEKGLQTLNGEQALAFARNRHSWPEYCGAKYSNYVSNDFIRGEHQQTVIKALLNKLKAVKNLDSIMNLLNILSNNMETNMTTSEILSLYNIGKDVLSKNGGADVSELISMQRLYLNGHDAYIYDQSMKLNLYNYVLYDASLNAVVKAMKVNLGLEEPELIKEFSFSIDKKYEETIIGKNEVSASSVKKLPDFTGDTEVTAKNTCNSLGITCVFKTTESGSGTNNTVISQSYNAGYDISYVGTVTLTILKKSEVKQQTTEKKVEKKVEEKTEEKEEVKTEDKKEEEKKEEPETPDPKDDENKDEE